MDVALATGADLPDLDADDRHLLAALRRRGLDARPAVWSDPAVDWSGVGACVVRSTWDYDRQRDAYLTWAEGVAAVTALWNPAEVLRWNTHKGYLLEFEERGAPIVPTAFTGAGDRVDVAALADARRWGDLVVKPAVSAGGRGMGRFARHDRAGAQAHFDALAVDRDVLVQPYVGSIATHGELSLVFVAGAFSHAVRKRPADGEFRIHERFGGRNERVTPDDDLVGLGAWVVEAAGADLLYARVDLVHDDDGTPLLGELEATEPSLYLAHAPEAAELLADAVVERLGARPAGGSRG